MSARPESLKADATLLDSLGELFRELPDSLWAEHSVHSSVWDAALLNPARDILSRSGKGFRARLVERAWSLAGGGAEGPPEILSVAIEVLHVGSLVIDDIEDDSRMRRGAPALHRQYGLPLALNTGNWLYFVALALLSRAPLRPELRLALYEDLSLALLRCHQGQALDVSVSITAQRRAAVPGLVATSTRLKTGSLMQMAALLGAKAADAPPDVADAIGRFGCELGVGLQMLDDWSGVSADARRDKGREDVRLARATWPWAWLAESADELVFAQTARLARDVSIDWEADRVLDAMRAQLSPIAPGNIREQLDAALQHLDLTGISASALDETKQHVDDLERAY